MIDSEQLRHDVIRPVLRYLDPVVPYSEAAENLLMGTCAHESKGGRYISQIKGPARGIFQMEPATEKDIHENYLEYRPELDDLVMALRMTPFTPILNAGLSNLRCNLYYQAAMARVHYYRVRFAMPENGNIAGMANYWKLHYNTPEGRGTEEAFIEDYMRLVK